MICVTPLHASDNKKPQDVFLVLSMYLPIVQMVAILSAREWCLPYSPFQLCFPLWLQKKQNPLWAVARNQHMAVWTPSCHHLRLRWSDKWDFNWVFRLSHIRRWDRIIQEHINVIKSSQIWQLYCIRKLPAFSSPPPSLQCQSPSRAFCFEQR